MATMEQETPKSARIGVLRQDCALLLVLWLVLLAFAGTAGDFPLNDDWNYGRTVKALIDERRLIVTQWSLAASLPHIMLGYISTMLAGFSFDALRAVSMVAGYAAATLTYLMSSRLGAPRFLSLIGAAALLTNPLFLNLSATFMTDITFAMFAATTLFSMYRLISSDKLRVGPLLYAGLLSTLMCLTRQTGLVIPIAFALVNRLKPKASIPLWMSGTAVYAFQIWLNQIFGVLHAYAVETEWIKHLVAKGPAYVMSNSMANLIAMFVYLGLFFLPVMVVTFPALLSSLKGKERRNAVIMFAEPVILVLIGLVMTHSIMPLGDNILFNLGLGPIVLSRSAAPVLNPGPEWFWVVVTGGGVIGAGCLVSTLVTAVTQVADKTSALSANTRRTYGLLLIACALYLAVIAFRGYFDRYLLFPLLLLMPMVTSMVRLPSAGKMRVMQPLAVLFLVLFGSFGAAGTHDYFVWNRARWQAAHDLTDVQHVSPMEIDGGLEFNGWYGYDPQFRESGGVTFMPDMIHGNEYALTMKPAPNFDVVSRYSYQKWLPLGSGEVLVLRKIHELHEADPGAGKPETPRANK